MVDMVSNTGEVIDVALTNEEEECCHKKWNDQSSRCPKAAEGFEPYHKWIPVSSIITPHMTAVTGLMCGICFHEVVVSDAHRHRDCFKT
jgi:hypothetical protein